MHRKAICTADVYLRLGFTLSLAAVLAYSSPSPGTPDTGYELCDFWAGSVLFGSSCYKVFEDLMTWKESKTACQSAVIGGRLAEPKNVETVAFVHELMMTSKIDGLANNGNDFTPYGAWIGLRKEVGKSEFAWVTDDSPLWSLPVHLEHSSVTSAMAHTGERHCMTLSVYNSQFYVISCPSKKRRVCQVEVDAICKRDLERYYDGQCYYFIYPDSMEYSNYDQAKATCEGDGSKLVEIHTEGMVTFLRDFLLETSWHTVNFDTFEDFMDLTDHGVSKTREQDFCFVVKGIGDAKIDLNKGTSGHGSSCAKHIYLKTSREDDEVEFTLSVCDYCNSESPCQSSKEITQNTPGNEWSSYCISQDVKPDSSIVAVSYASDGGGNAASFITVTHSSLNQELTSVRVFADTKSFQWKFPVQTGSVYIGAVGALDEWEHGGAIDYGLLGIQKLSSSPGQDRLIFQGFPSLVRSSDGVGDRTAVLCQYALGDHHHFGAVPFDLAREASIYISHATDSGVALFNHYPNMDAALTMTYMKTFSQDEGTISLYMFIDDAEDFTGNVFTFLIRSRLPITVELFALGDLYIYSTLVLSEDYTDTNYVINAPETSKGQLIIVNHLVRNVITLQPPKLRQLYFIKYGIKYRSYYMELGDVHEWEAVCLTFEGDISGTTVSGAHPFSVFVATTQAKDITFDQMLPSTWPQEGYTILKLPSNTLASFAHYKLTALGDQTTVEMHGHDTILLQQHGDTISTSVTTSEVRRFRSSNLVYASFLLADGQMACTTSLLPHRFWAEEYVMLVGARHQNSGHVAALGGAGMALLFVINGSGGGGGGAPSPNFSFNGVEHAVECTRLKDTDYFSCFYDSPNPGHYVIKSVSAGQKFAAYLIGGKTGVKCYCRLAGNPSLSHKTNDYIIPSFTEPEECPEPPTLPPIPTSPYFNVTLTPEIVEEIQETVRKELEVDHHTTSNYVRKKISVPDSRQSSQTFGIGGVVIISLVTFLLILPDGLTLAGWIVARMGVVPNLDLVEPEVS